MKVKTSAICAALLSATCASPVWALPKAWGEIDLTSIRQFIVDTDAADGILASFSTSFSGRSVLACLDINVTGCSVATANASETVSASQQENGITISGTAGPTRQYGEAEGVVPTETWGVMVSNLEHYTFSGAGRFTVEVDYTLGGADFLQTLGSVQAGLRLSAYDSVFAAPQLDFGPLSTGGSRSGTMSVTMDVVDGQVSGMSTYVWAKIDGMADQTAPPIPEPETWAMLLAGAGLVGVGARRRRS